MKIMLLKALKRGYFDYSDLETLESLISTRYNNLTDDELNDLIKELHRKLGFEVEYM
ncbi:MAG: hypothetical protein PHH37_04240 [Paludibacter sp.]|nr:hypothetical protein [Paludibacter sp.]